MEVITLEMIYADYIGRCKLTTKYDPDVILTVISNVDSFLLALAIFRNP